MTRAREVQGFVPTELGIGTFWFEATRKLAKVEGRGREIPSGSQHKDWTFRHLPPALMLGFCPHAKPNEQ